MSDQIYDHLAKWRRVLRDLAVEAGLNQFVNSPESNDEQPKNGTDNEV